MDSHYLKAGNSSRKDHSTFAGTAICIASRRAFLWNANYNETPTRNHRTAPRLFYPAKHHWNSPPHL